ncbi:alanine--tRNA ligase [Dethiosulfatarculus sandiegensis]|uniref:Alanine--tRNA ligase n=1 Tax=Dethiosulfatarculus sandiegensis TaxID=1429043 RepID=A0A0D2JQ74_9BACT|nr:alanine--tRNA ligase [Dethiosulfatarculus sandiegensis]KIX11640.1 alanyl-tRNA synthetase [Dethiosulfatarculus sandiegensis]
MSTSGNDIRQIFLDYFNKQGHKIVASSPLVPKDDPTLLFTNAGMVQFKKLFLGQAKRDYIRATTSQKCFRASGKHNDLENVGRTPRHHTFFEMLGNFSFGDYFKQDAIRFAWELLTEGYGLPKDKLWVSVFETDDEAAELWQSEVGVKPERIVRLGEEENFWSMGDTGPCGPCSEIHIDQGPEHGCGRADCAVGCDCDRYLELWNLVFMQYNRDESGKLTPLPKPSIDTGMGLERISAVVQGKYSNYDTDLFTPIMDVAAQLAGTSYGKNEEDDVSLRVIADHARACTFLISDGILPKNEGRGYVLRRILRRAARHGRKLGLKEVFLHQVAQEVIDQMKGAYPSLVDSRAFIDKVITKEEERFGETLDTGLKILYDATGEAKAKGETVLSGDTAFKLYDTYGFPLDLTMTIVEEEGLSVDEPGFDRAMETQRSRSRAAWKGSGEEAMPPALEELSSQGFATEFKGYETLEAKGKAVLILVDGNRVDQIGTGQEAEVVTDRTPFYADAGGQLGDTGQMTGSQGKAEVTGVTKPGGSIYVHKIKVFEGSLSQGQELSMEVSAEQRARTAANHTATHLLHAALRNTLGDHVKQAGSLVSPDRLRFDFSHFEAVTPEQIKAIENEVNQAVRANICLDTQVMGLEEAMKSGATALFEERYGDQVRIVSIPGVSKELCGGTHAHRTGDIGLVKVIGETSVAAGVRRLEAQTGHGAILAMQDMEDQLNQAAAALKVGRQELVPRLTKLQAQLKETEREMEKLKTQLASAGTKDLLEDAVEIDGVKVLATQVTTDNPKSLRELSDTLRDRIGSGVVVLGAKAGKKALLLVLVTKDLVKKVHAGNLVKALAPMVGGGGGGKPDLAQAGGQNPDGLPQAMAKAPELVREQLQQTA